MLTHPKSNSSKDYIVPPRGRYRLKFLHALVDIRIGILYHILYIGGGILSAPAAAGTTVRGVFSTPVE